ncbi:MAG: hypothetical protein AB7F59_09440 [Bdellovibrionales bacterium]
MMKIFGSVVLAGGLMVTTGALACDKSNKVSANETKKEHSCSCGKDNKGCACGAKDAKGATKSCGCKHEDHKS